MKYISTNIFSDFEFHDSYFKLESFKDDVLTVSVQYLNIHKNTEQNPFETDMEIEVAQITFEGFKVKSFSLGVKWKRDEKGELYTDETEVVFEGETAQKKLVNEFCFGATVLDFGTLENGNNFIDGIGDEPWFSAQFTFHSATIQWDKFKKVAWYEEKSNKQIAFTCCHVIEENKPILYVKHDVQGDWQFLCGGNHTIEDARIISLDEALKIDIGLCKLLNLKCGQIAVRESEKSEWKLL